jgi:hypothetical protein
MSCFLLVSIILTNKPFFYTTYFFLCRFKKVIAQKNKFQNVRYTTKKKYKNHHHPDVECIDNLGLLQRKQPVGYKIFFQAVDKINFLKS